MEFESSEEDREAQESLSLENPCGECSAFPVFSGKRQEECIMENRRQEERLRGGCPGICAPQR